MEKVVSKKWNKKIFVSKRHIIPAFLEYYGYAHEIYQFLNLLCRDTHDSLLEEDENGKVHSFLNYGKFAKCIKILLFSKEEHFVEHLGRHQLWRQYKFSLDCFQHDLHFLQQVFEAYPDIEVFNLKMSMTKDNADKVCNFLFCIKNVREANPLAPSRWHDGLAVIVPKHWFFESSSCSDLEEWYQKNGSRKLPFISIWLLDRDFQIAVGKVECVGKLLTDTLSLHFADFQAPEVELHLYDSELNDFPVPLHDVFVNSVQKVHLKSMKIDIMQVRKKLLSIFPKLTDIEVETKELEPDLLFWDELISKVCLNHNEERSNKWESFHPWKTDFSAEVLYGDKVRLVKFNSLEERWNFSSPMFKDEEYSQSKRWNI